MFADALSVWYSAKEEELYGKVRNGRGEVSF